MKFVSLSRIKPLFFLTLLVFSLIFSWQPGYAQQQSQLSLADIVSALRSKKVTLDERNKLITEGVKTRGITFALSADLEKELRTAGAGNELIEAIRQKSPVVKVSATTTPPPQTPVAEPKPNPVSTPRPPDYSFYQNRANANFVLGEYDLAIADYSKAIELNSKDSTVFFSRAFAYLNKKSYNQAIVDFNKVIELDPTESTAYFKRGNALENIGSLEKAMNDYQKTVELDSDNEQAKESLQRLQALLLPKPASSSVANTAVSATPNKVQTKQPEPVKESPNPTPIQNLGALNAQAVNLEKPNYPAFERQRRTEGLVTVEIALDEKGKVLSAKAVSGPKSLRGVSEDAARRSKFKPVLMDKKPVRATGFINYNFKANL